jgi:16S rRNA processing protein RimM
MKPRLNLHQKRNPRNNITWLRINDPMSYKASILLGRITKVKGYEGAVTIKLEKSFTDKIPDLKSVFLEIEGKPVPFIIAESDYMGNSILKIKFKGYDSIKKINEFTGCSVFLASGNGIKSDNSDLSGLIGFQVISADQSLAGFITKIIDNPGQLLLNVEMETGKQLLVPLHEDLIVRINKKKKLIIMDLPEGLIEIN